MIKLLELLGLSSIILLNSGWAIQAYKIYRTKSVRDLSLPFLLVAFFSLIGLQIFTLIEIKSFTYIVGNSMGIIFTGILLFFKLIYEEN